MKQLHDFLPGDRVALLYPGVGANRHVGTVTRVTPTSIFIQVDGLSKPKRFGKGRWHSDLSHLALVDRISAELPSTAGLKPPHVSTHFL